jgi:hypothetical protein
MGGVEGLPCTRFLQYKCNDIHCTGSIHQMNEVLQCFFHWNLFQQYVLWHTSTTLHNEIMLTPAQHKQTEK